MQNDFHTEVTDCVATGTVLNLLHQKLLRKLRFPVLLLIRAITSAPQGIRLTEFLGGLRSIHLSYGDGCPIIIQHFADKIKLNRKAKWCML